MPPLPKFWTGSNLLYIKILKNIFYNILNLLIIAIQNKKEDIIINESRRSVYIYYIVVRNWLCPGLSQGSHKVCAGNLSEKIGGNCLENRSMHPPTSLHVVTR